MPKVNDGKLYVLVFQDYNVHLVGPFLDESEAGAWGQGWQYDHKDNPCWQAVWLIDPVVPVREPYDPGEETE